MPALTIELTEQEQARLEQLAAAQGVDVPDCARALLGQRLNSREPLTPVSAAGHLTPPTVAPQRKPIWKRAVEAGMALPAEERARIPRDGSVNLDHYVYGLPKRP
jgi:hypothetical protein